MIRMSRIFLWCSALALVLLSPAYAYERGDWLVRGQVAGTYSEPGGDGLPSPGLRDARFDYSEQWRLAIQLDYMLFDSVSLGLGLPLEGYRHHIFVDDGTASRRVMDAQMFPLTVSVSWYLPKWHSLRARLVGAWQHALASDDDYRRAALQGVGNAELGDARGAGFGLGIEWDRDSNWSWDLAVTRFALSQTLTTYSPAGEIDVDIDPQMLNWSLGLTRRF